MTVTERCPETYCITAVATPLWFNAPTDRQKKCHIRKHLIPQYLLEEKPQETKYPKGRSYVANTASYWPTTGNLLGTADVTSLIDAYTSINNSLTFVGDMPLFSHLRKNSDFLLLPGTIHANVLRAFFTGAHYQPASVCFLNRRRPVVSVHFIGSWKSFVTFPLCLSCLAL